MTRPIHPPRGTEHATCSMARGMQHTASEWAVVAAPVFVAELGCPMHRTERAIAEGLAPAPRCNTTAQPGGVRDATRQVTYKMQHGRWCTRCTHTTPSQASRRSASRPRDVQQRRDRSTGGRAGGRIRSAQRTILHRAQRMRSVGHLSSRRPPAPSRPPAHSRPSLPHTVQRKNACARGAEPAGMREWVGGEHC